ncbi:GIY-YIG nuclease family protein [Neobacillus drentensis]|uniref:GIY-YIG nuclease family protein n=1 Tax=Neobacillus drentensis TaxID=220684 RepID=UPI00285B50B9|nr:GIY-YIG nuclease family protein [Neobacillus drentensis]MDR7239661.1 hypothetical protein [Neobacillus drentensis]
MSKKIKNDKLKELINDDPLGLLNIENKSYGKSKTEEQRLIESFAEISEFFEEHSREPSSENGLGEHILKSRLVGIRSNPKKVKALLPYDFYNLLRSQETMSVSVEEILMDDPLNLLSMDGDDESIFKLKHVKKTERIRPENISRRTKCKDFEKYEPMFSLIHQELKEGKRKLVEFNEKDVTPGNFYVLRGVVLYLEKIDSEYQEKQYSTGNRMRLDGRTTCIFDNGTESSMLLRSLNKALNIDGFGISERLDSVIREVSIDENDVQNGYIYVLKSLSKKTEIANYKNLYKVGYSSGDVTNRIKNAPNEPTYLMSPVELLLTVRCFNLDVKYLETSIHEFFNEVNVTFEVTDRQGKIHKPREWFVAPLEIIEEAIQLVVEEKIQKNKYNPLVGEIILRES